MEIRPSKTHLLELLASQLRHLFLLDISSIREEIDQTLQILEKSFDNFNNKYYRNDAGYLSFSASHGTQYTMFLYWVSRLLSEKGKKLEADKVYQLNKMMSGCDLFHEVKLPLRTYCDHPFGAVIGRGIIGENFYFSHGCTIGNNKNIFPISEGFLVMLPGSTLVGKSTLGSHVVLSGGSYVKDENIPSFSVVFGSTPNLKIKRITEKQFSEYSPFLVN